VVFQFYRSFFILDCRNCVVEWEPWSECIDGLRRRAQYIVVGASDGGRPCPNLIAEDESE